MSDDKKVVDFRRPDEPDAEERARRLNVTADRLAHPQRPKGEYLAYLESEARTLGIPEAKLREIVEAKIKAHNEAKREQREAEQRAERRDSTDRKEKAKVAEKEQRERAKRKQQIFKAAIKLP